MLTLAAAAEQAGVNRSTVFRWIKSGRVSATKADDGGYRVDPAELSRYLDSIKTVASSPVQQSMRTDAEQQTATPSDVAALRERCAAMGEKIAGLEALLATERQRGEELKAERDRWAAQAERLALAPPAAPRVSLWRRVFG